jgi:hypothetical protein
MDCLGVVTVRHERLLQGCVEDIVARLGLIFVDEFVPPSDACEECVTVDARQGRCQIQLFKTADAAIREIDLMLSFWRMASSMD